MAHAIAMLPIEVINAAKADMIAGLSARKALEQDKKKSAAYAQICATLSRHQKRIARLDAYAVTYLATNALTVISDDETVIGSALFRDLFTVQARHNAFLNEKAIPRILTISRLLNGGVIDTSSADEEATACVIDALRKGLTAGSDIKAHMRRVMLRGTFGKPRAAWDSEGTQGSSTLRALLVTGIVHKADGRTWHVANKTKLARLADGIDGKKYEGDARRFTMQDLPEHVRDVMARHKANNATSARDQESNASNIAGIPAALMLEAPDAHDMGLSASELELIAESARDVESEVSALLALPAPATSYDDAGRGVTPKTKTPRARRARAKTAK